MVDRRSFMTTGALAALSAALPAFGQSVTPQVIEVDVKREVGPLDHIWSKSVGSDRAAITLRETWRKDVARFQKEAGIERVRFHGIFNDELGVHAPSLLSRSPEPNFQNIDQVYDGLLDLGVRPIVELSFMPKRLASGTRTFGFYAGNVTPPKSMEEWAKFIRAFVTHLIERYGLAEVRNWPFEVWNEPNLPFFWSGTQAQYFELYAATAVTIKSIDPELQVGGPSTSMIAWLPEFLSYCEQNNAPVDFVSTHIYAGDDQKPLFGQEKLYAQADVIPAAMAKARQQIDASAFKGRPLWLTEWSSDSPAMIAHVITRSLGHCQLMSQWAASSAFEELGVPSFVLKEGDAGWGMMAPHNIAKPAFNTYKLLHRLGTQRLATAPDAPVLAARRSDGSTSILVWNLADVAQPSGIPGVTQTRTVNGEAKRLRVLLKGARAGQTAKVSYVDQERGSPMPKWRALGSPVYPTRSQLAEIRASAELPSAEKRKIGPARELVIDLPPEGVALIEL